MLRTTMFTYSPKIFHDSCWFACVPCVLSSSLFYSLSPWYISSFGTSFRIMMVVTLCTLDFHIHCQFSRFFPPVRINLVVETVFYLHILKSLWHLLSFSSVKFNSENILQYLQQMSLLLSEQINFKCWSLVTPLTSICAF